MRNLLLGGVREGTGRLCRRARRHRPAHGVEANEVTGGAALVPVPEWCSRMLAASSAATPCPPSSPKPDAAIRRRHGHRLRRAMCCVSSKGTRDGMREESGEGLAPYPRQSRPHMPNPTFRRGRRVDGVSFDVLPGTADELPSTPGVRSGRPATPSRCLPPVFLACDVFHLPSLKVRSSIAFTVLDADGARSSMDGCSAPGRVCWWARVRPPGGGGALRAWWLDGACAPAWTTRDRWHSTWQRGLWERYGRTALSVAKLEHGRSVA